jgi:glycosyltransferase involved in cell wall biosynthesis
LTNPRATILIPTHDHYATLPISVNSAQNQTVMEIEIIIIGDGATNETKRAAESLASSDTRIKYLHFPKGPNHGEVYRHIAIEKSLGDYIFYLCDDDLFAPYHVENLLSLLGSNDFAQSRNGYFDVNGQLCLFPTDLSRQDVINWHLLEPRRNFVSLTGTAHRRTTYFQLSEFWETTPKDEWPDHFMWKKFFRHKGLKAATHPEMSALQFPTSAGRETTNQEMRLEELAKWSTFISQTNSRSNLDKLVNEATTKSVVDLSMILINQSLTSANLCAVTAERDHILARISWQITKGLRKIRSMFRTS